MRILHVDACGLTTGQSRLIFEREHVVYEATDLAEEALDLARLYDYDVIVTEATLLDQTGLWLIQKMRLARISTPVIVLSAVSDVATKVEYLRSGADDYMAKPHHPAELLIRTQALARRSRGHSSSTITNGVLTLDTGEKTLQVLGAQVHLTGKEYRVLELLMSRLGATQTKESLMNHLYNGMDEPELKIIDVFICKLRKKLGRAHPPAERYIRTVWGRGYVMQQVETQA